jgi:hypothetical protein
VTEKAFEAAANFSSYAPEWQLWVYLVSGGLVGFLFGMLVERLLYARRLPDDERPENSDPRGISPAEWRARQKGVVFLECSCGLPAPGAVPKGTTGYVCPKCTGAVHRFIIG